MPGVRLEVRRRRLGRGRFLLVLQELLLPGLLVLPLPVPVLLPLEPLPPELQQLVELVLRWLLSLLYPLLLSP